MANSSSELLSTVKSILKDLVCFKSISRSSNLELINYISTYLKNNDINSSIIYSDDKTCANLFATIGDCDNAGVVLSGHTDVVPVNEAEWSFPPFDLTEENQNLYGRGSVDMKGFIACVLAMVPIFKKSNLSKPLHLCFSYDEEVGCLGVHSLIRYINQNVKTTPKLAIVGEPTGMKIIKSQKGKVTYRCRIKGQAGHSSMAPEFNNTIEIAARIITNIAEIAKANKINGPFEEGYDINHNTLVTTLVKGGNATNIIPDFCEFCFEVRYLPSHNIDATINKIKENAQQIAIDNSPINSPPVEIFWERLSYNPGLTNQTKDVDDFHKIIDLLSDENEKASFGTEAPFFQINADIPSIICGPGDIVMAHQPDEYVSIEQLQSCLTFLNDLQHNYLVD